MRKHQNCRRISGWKGGKQYPFSASVLISSLNTMGEKGENIKEKKMVQFVETDPGVLGGA